jgi:hypothetical protein
MRRSIRKNLEAATSATVMVRIIVDPAPGQGDLAEGFVKALNLLNNGGFKVRPGTKLVSLYAVIVIGKAASPQAIAKLHAGEVPAYVERQ